MFTLPGLGIRKTQLPVRVKLGCERLVSFLAISFILPAGSMGEGGTNKRGK